MKIRPRLVLEHLLNELLHWGHLALVNKAELIHKVYQVLEGGVQMSLSQISSAITCKFSHGNWYV